MLEEEALVVDVLEVVWEDDAVFVLVAVRVLDKEGARPEVSARMRSARIRSR